MRAASSRLMLALMPTPRITSVGPVASPCTSTSRPASLRFSHNTSFGHLRPTPVTPQSALGALVLGRSLGDDVQLRVRGGVVEGAQIPQVIDELPMLAALGPYTEEGVEIRDAAELRVKESDRIAALAENLRRMGAKVEERSDGLRVEGRGAGKLRGAEIDSKGDHRIAMAFAIAGLAADGPTTISGAECASVSYPAFFEDLNRLAER